MSQYNFKLEIPESLLETGRHTAIDLNPLEGKIIIGLSGYARSGKDTIANKLVSDYGFHRIAFADNLKRNMNKLMKEAVLSDLKENGTNIIKSIDDIDFENPASSDIKEELRPYIIWLGEKVREINGTYYWINKAIRVDASGYDRIVISDVRRPDELNIFDNSNSFLRRTKESLLDGGYTNYQLPQTKSYSALLFWINQFGLTDNDPLTIKTIQLANERWLFDETVLIDSRLPSVEKYRDDALNKKIKKIANKYGIDKPKREKFRQSSIFDFL